MEPATVLVVDDEELIRWTLRQLLSAHGFHVVEAGTGREARALLDAGITAAFLDLRLPDTDGITLARELLAIAPQCAVYLMTAYRDASVTAKAQQAGIRRVLDKPFDFEEIEELALSAVQGAGDTGDGDVPV